MYIFLFIFCKPQEILSHRSVRLVIKMHPRIVSRLQRLGLYQVAMLGNINVDPNLIAGLVERWRSECHCFNFNFGEMTVTMEDISCLWGLSIQGEPITGESDSGTYRETLERVLHRPVPETAFRRQNRRARGGEGTRVTYSGYNLRLKWLRTQFTRVGWGYRGVRKCIYYSVLLGFDWIDSTTQWYRWFGSYNVREIPWKFGKSAWV